jgi:hypothetical protein
LKIVRGDLKRNLFSRPPAFWRDAAAAVAAICCRCSCRAAAAVKAVHGKEEKFNSAGLSVVDTFFETH